MERKALEYLEKNSLFHMGMIFPIKRSSAEVIYADFDGVFMRDKTSEAFMLSFTDLDKGIGFLETLGRVDLICVYQKEIADYLKQKHSYAKCMANFQAVYMRKEPVEVVCGGLEIKPLTTEHLEIVYEHYHDDVSYEYLKRRLEDGAIFGGFVDGELCGFAGTHEEGAVGILRVLEKFRRRGFGAALEGYVINEVLKRGEVPFVQVNPWNEASIRLQMGLGFEVSREVLWWLFD